MGSLHLEAPTRLTKPAIFFTMVGIGGVLGAVAAGSVGVELVYFADAALMVGTIGITMSVSRKRECEDDSSSATSALTPE